MHLSSRLVVCLCLPSLFPLIFTAQGQEPEPEVGAVKIDLMIGPGLSVAGGGSMTWDLYSFPDFSSTGTGVFKARFLETDPDLPVRYGGYALLEWTGSNSAQLLLRDLDLDYKSIRFDPFSSTTDGIFYSATHEDETQRSIYKHGSGRIEHEGGLLLGSDDGTVVFTDIIPGNLANISLIKPGGAPVVLVKFGDPVPGLEGVTFKGLQRVHVNPNGGVAFASSLNGTGVDFNNDWALFRTNPQGGLELLVREGDAYPADTRLPTDGKFVDIAFNQTGFGFNGSAAAAFTALVTNPNPQSISAADSLWYVRPDSNTPSLVAVSGVPLPTEHEGTITFNSFTYYGDGAKIPPMVDVAGAIIFFAELQDGLNVSRPAIWRWNGETVSKIIDLDQLPFHDIENKTVTISDVCLSSRGRIAMIGVVDGLAQVIWAQDDQGRFANVITRDPVNSGEYSNENLVLDSGTDLGKVRILGTLAGVYNDASGGEDGLMSPWWTPEEKLMFSVEVEGSLTTPYICQATIGKGVEIAKGNTYIWDEGLATMDWHTVQNGQTNWVDANGVRWDKPPTKSSAKVIIPPAFLVSLNQNVNEIASLDAESKLELSANLTVREMTKLGAVKINGDYELISRGEVSVDGEIVSGTDGVRVVSTTPNSLITTKGAITGINTGIWATAVDGMTIDNEAAVSAVNSIAMLAQSESGNIQIKNRGTINSSKGSGIVATSTTGDISIGSPDSGSFSPDISVVGSGVKATSAGRVDVTFSGEISAFSSQEINDDWGIRAESTEGSVSVVSKGTISGIGTFGPGGIFAKGRDTVLAKHEGVFFVPSSPIRGLSTDGDVTVDGRNTFISSDLGGLRADAPHGNATVLFEGEMGVGRGYGIQVAAGADILVESNGSIQTIGAPSAISSADGIWAESTDGNVILNHSGTISTFHSFYSSGIVTKAEKDITINTTGDLSTFAGSGIVAQSTSGFVDIKHTGPITASNRGHGIYATSETGFITIVSADPDSTISGTGDDSSGTALEANAGGSVLIEWAGDIETWGSRVSTLFAKSSTAGVTVTTKGNVSAYGSSSFGVVLSGPSNLTLNLLGGSVTGGDGLGGGLVFVDGTTNKLLNRGSLSSYNFQAIKAGSGNETIDNYGQISGSIDLGSGTHVIENRSGALLVTHNDLKIGTGNFLNNHGHLQIGELGEETLTTTLEGNLFLEVSSSYRMEIEDTTIAGEPITDQLIVNGSATIDGELIISLQELYDEPKAGDTFTILTADSITGTFFHRRVLNSSNRFAEISRKVGVDLSYTETTVTGTVSLLEIDRYDDWKELVFNETQKADESVSGPDANPDGDGLTNGDEALFGGDPTKPDGSPVSFDLGDVNPADGIQISATFNVADDITDREWYFETSPDLGVWTDADVTVTTQEDRGDFSRLTVAFDQPVSNDGRTFVRLKSRAKL